MADRKATFAKRQRETDVKDKAREKEARRLARRNAPRTTKGPEIAWDQAVRYIESPLTGDLAPSVDPGEDVIPDGPTRPSAPQYAASTPAAPAPPAAPATKPATKPDDPE